MALLSLVPQAHLLLARGRDWQGAYAYFYTDEPAYAAYLGALIDGRPRRTDPYTGRDDSPAAPLPESLFSIQFAPAYLLAWPARLFNLSAATVFVLLMPLVAASLALAIYWLAWSVARDRGLAFASVFVVLCLGIAVSGGGWAAAALGQPGGYVFLPFLRRYVPGVPLVFLFLFCGSMWRALTAGARRARLLHALAAGVLFALQVYSYFYHWTTSAALLVCLAAAWAAARPAGWRGALAPFAVVCALAAASLAPYFALLARRAPSMDAAQALLHTREPDLWRGVLLLAALTLLALARGARRGLVRWRDPAALFAAALAGTVVLVFNQQLVTGRSLQPMHYEQYVGNYLVLLAAALACGLLWRGRGLRAANHEETRAARHDERVRAHDDDAGRAAGFDAERTTDSDAERATGFDARRAPRDATRRTAHGDTRRDAHNDTRRDARDDAGRDARDDADGASSAVGPRLLPRRVWACAAAAAFLWGAGETLPAARDYAPLNAMHDDWRAVVLRLDQLAREAERELAGEASRELAGAAGRGLAAGRELTREAGRDPARAAAGTRPVVFNPSDTRMDHVPANSRCAVVWAPHTFAYSSLTAAQNKERVFLFLHFAGVTPADFAAQGRDQGFLQFNVFGWERANPRLTADYRPVTPAEIDAERRNYAEFVRRVESGARAPEPLLSFVVASDDQPLPFANLDRFYTRDAGERLGRHTIYRVRPR